MSTDDARTRILKAAGPVFAEKGYETATVREICDAAGVNLAAINYYFGGKERLYTETFKQAHPIADTKVVIPDWPEGTPPEKKLRDYIHVKMMRLIGVGHEPWQSRLLLREMLDPTPAAYETLRNYIQKDFGVLVRIIDELVPPETPTHRRHQLASSVISQCVHYRFADKILKMVISEEEWAEHYGAQSLAEHITQVCLAAFGCGPPVVSQWEGVTAIGTAQENQADKS